MAGDDEASGPDLGVFHMPAESTLKDVAEHISRLGADRFRGLDGFAYVFSSQLQADPDDSRGVLSYEHARPIYIVDKVEGQLRLRLVVGDGLSEAVPIDGLQRIQEADLMDMMLSDGSACIMEPGGNYHFVTPSLMHTNRFLRIGDLIRTRSTLDRLVFWIERVIAGAQGLLIDTWSIASLGLRAMQRQGSDIPFDCLPEHPAQDNEACRAVIERLLTAMPRDGRLLVLISISGSGRLIEQIKTATDQLAPEGIEIVFLSLYGFKSTPSEIECIARIDDNGGTYPEAECRFCEEGSSPIPLDSSSYHLRSWREVRVMTGEDHFAPGKDFLNRYQDVDNLFFLHRDDPSDQRHHAFDIDVLRLLEVEPFQGAMVEQIRQFLGKKDLIVAPSHAAAARLVNIASEILSIPAVVHDTLDSTMDDTERKSLLAGARHLLILDDTFNSGTRLTRYIQSLREGGYGDFDTVDCLVAVARPESELELNRASRAIANRHPWKGNLHFVEMLLLPRWSERACPWCKEFDLLSRLEELYPKPPAWLLHRNQRLASRRAGISCEPFLVLPSTATPVLGSGSVVGNEGLTGEKVVFGVASALQRHRCDGDQNRQLHPDFPLSNVLDPRLFSTRYTEGLIRAAFLRTTTRHELGNQASAERRDYLLEAMRSDNQQILAGEILAALGRKTFPVISASTFATRFEGLLPELDLQRLARIIELPQPKQ